MSTDLRLPLLDPEDPDNLISPNPIQEDNNGTATIPISTEPETGSPNRTLLTWTGAKPIPLVICILTGLIIRFAIPKPVEVSARAWQLLSLFITTVAGLVLAPLPVGAWSFICLSMTLVTKTLSFQEGLIAATNEVIWLIVVAFFFSRGFVKSGLGDRVAAYFIKWLGRKTVGLSYGIVLSEAVVAPAIPSSTARAGGVFCPVIKSVAMNVRSLPNDNSAKKLGSFLMMAQTQVLLLFL